jgi:hypothetical protein
VDIVANDAERRMVLDMLPKYLNYLLHVCPAEPSLLVKTLGLFQIRFRHTTVASTWEDMHFVLMENMFHGRKVTSKFDLKGIQTRSAQSSTSTNDFALTNQTLWDADFLHAIHRQSSRASSIQSIKQPQKAGSRLSKAFSGLSLSQPAPPTNTSLYLHPPAKLQVQQALARDTAFLRDANVIDYSLLVGIDDQRGELVMGLVDYFGAYDMWKRLENHGKTTLQVLRQSTASLSTKLSLDPMASRTSSWMDLGGWLGSGSENSGLTPKKSEQTEVTVQPPSKYQQRFMRAMDTYFLMVPDVFTKE